MADLGMSFDHNTVEPGRDFEPIPAGEYLAQITSSEVKPTSNGQGMMLKLRFDLLDGQSYAGRVVFDQLCHLHSNPQTQLIAQQQLKRICEAVGHAGPLTNSDDLHFKPLVIKVAIDPAKDGYASKNVVKSVKPVNGTAPSSASSQATNSAARPAASGGSPATARTQPPAGRPWGNRGATAA